MAKTKFFRIAVEGTTVDGRVIQRDWLEQMAAGYNPTTYTARINCEHIAGFSPDKPFNCYGSVLALGTEEIELSIDGKTEKRLALTAQIDANDQLVEINKAGQKFFTSAEIHPDFAGTGKAYLVGLAVTDSPASLGTEPLKFAAMTRPNLFTTGYETTIDLEAQAIDTKAVGESIGQALLNFLRGGKPETPPVAPVAPAAPVGAPAFNAEGFSKVLAEQIAAAVKPHADAVAAVSAKFDALETKLAQTEAPNGFTRTPATGSPAFIQTDC